MGKLCFTILKYKRPKIIKNNRNISITVFGKNKILSKDQIKFNAIEEGTFFTRDLVSEPGNILHPDEYAKRINKLRKFQIQIDLL